MKLHNDDIHLFKQINNGHAKALDRLFNKYYEPLCNFAFLFLKDTKLTEEIVDDVFINIWRKRKEITIHTNPKAYLYRSTRNMVISHLRKNAPYFDSIEALESEKVANTPATPESLMIRKEIAGKVTFLLEKLPVQAGLVFRMHKMDGLKYKEIAEVLNLSIKTVENHMGRALKIFRLMYKENANFFDD